MSKEQKPISGEPLSDDDLAFVAGGRKLIWDDGYQQYWDDGTITGQPNPRSNPTPADPPQDDEWL